MIIMHVIISILYIYIYMRTSIFDQVSTWARLFISKIVHTMIVHSTPLKAPAGFRVRCWQL